MGYQNLLQLNATENSENFRRKLRNFKLLVDGIEFQASRGKLLVLIIKNWVAELFTNIYNDVDLNRWEN